jgi:hypothetical protein
MEIVKKLEDESEAIEKNLMEILWYMRGGINLNDAYNLTWDQRKYIFELIKENSELSKKTGKAIY